MLLKWKSIKINKDITRFIIVVINPTDLPNLKFSEWSDMVDTIKIPIIGTINSDKSNIYKINKINKLTSGAKIIHIITIMYNNKFLLQYIYLCIYYEIIPFFLMIISLLIFLLISNAVTSRQDKSILFSRIVIQSLIFAGFIAMSNLYINPLEKGIGIYGGLFNVNVLTQSFDIFIFLISGVILILTGFYPRKVYIKEIQASLSKLLTEKFSYNKNLISNKNGEQFRSIEYSLIIVFSLCGSVFLISTGDLVSVFLCIELQSYGLYILSTLYRDSESATASGLTYFLLGGLSSCFILLGSALLYANSGVTSLDNIYTVYSMSEEGLT